MTQTPVELFQAIGGAVTAAALAPLGAGAISIRTPESVTITREGAFLNLLTAADLCEIGRTTMPPVATPAYDTPIHRAVYVASGAKAILHTHPPHAIALSYDRQSFAPSDLEGRHLLGEVAVVSARRSVVDIVTAALEEHLIVIVAGHGVYARGADLWQCLRWTAMLEASAQIEWLRGQPPRP